MKNISGSCICVKPASINADVYITRHVSLSLCIHTHIHIRHMGSVKYTIEYNITGQLSMYQPLRSMQNANDFMYSRFEGEFANDSIKNANDYKD